jgi:parvulin-like peptidyl-prolyl isomerase
MAPAVITHSPFSVAPFVPRLEVQMKSSLRILAALAGALLLACSAHAQVPANKPAAVVNNEPITMVELDAVIKASQPASTAPMTEAQRKELQSNALNLLIEDLLMRQYLRKNAAGANPQEIEKQVQELVADLAKNKQTLAEFLAASGQTEAQLRADIAARLQWKNFITPHLTDQAVKQYYDDNKFFFDKVLVRASHILLKVAPNASQNDRQMVYNRALAIRQEIMTGKIQFADAAKKYSDCPSKENGGDIGLFPYKFAVLEPFAKAAYSMKIGSISEVVATDFGFHIIKVTDRTNGQPSDFQQIKGEVKEIYAQDVYQRIIADQKRTAKIEIHL